VRRVVIARSEARSVRKYVAAVSFLVVPATVVLAAIAVGTLVGSGTPVFPRVLAVLVVPVYFYAPALTWLLFDADVVYAVEDDATLVATRRGRRVKQVPLADIALIRVLNTMTARSLLTRTISFPADWPRLWVLTREGRAIRFPQVLVWGSDEAILMRIRTVEATSVR
jgi:hypothetical protein